MAMGVTSVKPARRQHYIARFYLRNFADPMFSDNLCVYDIRRRRWERRTPEGVGWFRHLCSMIDMTGNRTDAFDQYFKVHVEDPAAPALKKLAMGAAVDADERSAVAMFVALTAARSPELMESVVGEHLDKLPARYRAELDDLVELWCNLTRQPYGPKARTEFLKPSSLGAIWVWSRSLQYRLLQWEWHLVGTTRDRPFVTSDRPVLAQWDRGQDARLVTFPISSEVALVVINGGRFNEARDQANEAYAMNRGTMDRASEFVVAWKESFPGDDYLTKHGARA